MKHVAILGCGPSGLLCAWAMERAGHEPLIYSRKIKSVIPGSQHLHGPIPDLTSPYPEGTIQFVRLGTAEGYASKVYGDPERETGWENYLQVFPSWNVIRAYDKLWEYFEDRIMSITFHDYAPGLIYNIVHGADLTISTLPAQEICLAPEQHDFHGVRYYIKQLPTPSADADHEIVVYNGLVHDRWYRWSILGGKCSIEYPDGVALPDPFITGFKAIGNNCSCWPQIQRCGRWAEWRHGVTMFKAYQKAELLARELA